MRTDEALLLKPGEARSGAPFNIFGDQIFVKLGGDDTDGNYAIMEGITPPQGGPPLHRHGREDESFFILEGEYLFEVDGKQIHAGPGCSVFAPRGSAHAMQNLSDTPGRLLVIVQPAGLDAFFSEVDRATRGMKEPDMSVVLPIFQKYGLEFLGPPLGARSAAVAKSA